MTELNLPCGRVVLIDECDVHLLAGMNWHSDKRGRTYYVRGRVRGQNKGGAYLHNLIMGRRADHRNGDGLDNRRDNLRPCTQAENILNKAPKHGKIFKGVYKRGPSFRAQIYLNGKSYTSGGHPTAEEAARAYDRMAIGLHKEFARLNFPEGETVLRMLDRKDARQGEMFL